jgi:hypothetical protein
VGAALGANVKAIWEPGGGLDFGAVNRVINSPAVVGGISLIILDFLLPHIPVPGGKKYINMARRYLIRPVGGPLLAAGIISAVLDPPSGGGVYSSNVGSLTSRTISVPQRGGFGIPNLVR